MSITVELPPETEQNLRDQARLEGKTPEEVLSQLAQQWLGNGKSADGRPPNEMSAEEWSAKLRAWAASHEPVGHFVDDSRESIYAGRGE
jgi:hypothetical protein